MKEEALAEAVQRRERNQRGAGARLREEIISAAMRILDRAPASELSLRMVAKEAGIAAPSVYAHFESADAMIADVVRECWRELGAAISEAADVAEVDDPLERLQARMAAYVQYAMERPSRYQLLFALQMSVEAWSKLDGPVRPAYRPVLEAVEALEKRGVPLPMSDAESSAILIISIAHGRIGLAQLARARSGNSPKGVEAFVRSALKGIFSRAD